MIQKLYYLILPTDPIERFSESGGGKAKNLGKLTQKGFSVPPWFCLSARAFDEFVERHQLSVFLKPQEPFLEFSQKVEERFLALDIPDAIEEEVRFLLSQLDLMDSFVAVRSSGLDEDSKENSFAGQFSSYLFQKGMDQVLESIKRCWASAYSERALAYRKERGIGFTGVSVGVVIQKMINAESSGVAFSRHPLKLMDPDLVLVSSVFGLGEGLVSGALEADHFEFDLATKKLVSNIVEKESAMRQASGGGVELKSLESSQREAASLSDAEVVAISKLCRDLEAHFEEPQDIEWATSNGKIYLLQTRPVTTLPGLGFYDSKVKGTAPILWDNSNIIESYSGVTSPLTFSFASRAYNQVYIQFCEIMGVPKAWIATRDSMFRNMLGLIRGRIYYNLINWYRLVLLLPGSSTNKSFMETMMGVKQSVKPEHAGIFEFVKHPPRYPFHLKIILMIKTLWRFYRIDFIISDFRTAFDRAYHSALGEKFYERSMTDLTEYYQHLENEVLKRWHAPIINDYLCMIFFGLLKKLTENWVGKGSESLQNDLLCGEGGLESTEPTKTLMRIAETIDHGERDFKDWFLTLDPDTALTKIHERSGSDEMAKKVAAGFSEFLRKYGFRCVNELKLEENDLHDDPSFAINSVMGYLRTKSYFIEEMEKREREIRSKAETKIKTKLSGLKLKIYFWVLKQARRAVKNRENLRFARTKIFGVCRHIFRGMGAQLTKLGAIDAPRDVFYLTVDEIFAWTEGRAVLQNYRALVQMRKAEFQEFIDTPAPPDRLITIGAVGAITSYNDALLASDLMKDEPVENLPPGMYKGTPCSPGVIEGVVRVVTSLKDAQGIQGEILVTARTDPGWVPLYPSCSGLIIERGSLLSHSAVVARELGLPTIVGISGGLLKVLKSGQRVRMDATRGEVQILES